MKMTPVITVFGSIVIFAAIFFISVFLPWKTIPRTPSEIWRPRTDLEAKGRETYMQNGCTYCHSQFIRAYDWGHGAVRIAREGDYIAENPHLLGTERTGPDLSQEGGLRSNDWHLAHFFNPRFVRPESVMPNWEFLGMEKINLLINYMQSLGFKMADARTARQDRWKEPALKAFRSGPDRNVAWIHAMVPEPWRKLPNPYPATDYALQRGHRIYQGFCIGCHGPVGDGMGRAEPFLDPPPLNFTILKDRGISGGIIYYQIMNGVTGTAMPYFKGELESEKIWDVGNYIAVYFIGQSDANIQPEGIDAALEPSRGN